MHILHGDIMGIWYKYYKANDDFAGGFTCVACFFFQPYYIIRMIG